MKNLGIRLHLLQHDVTPETSTPIVLQQMLELLFKL